MQLSVQLILIGIVTLWIGIVVLFIGKKPDISYTDIFALGRRVYDKLDEVFGKPHVLTFKLFAYVGLILVFGGIGAIFYELGG
jgi:hypothetical protein